MSTSQGTAVAEIAMTLTDRPTPTAVEILSALNRAYEAGERAGFADGVVKGSANTASLMERTLIAMGAPL